MYLDAALKQHVGKIVFIFMKSGHSFRGLLTGVDSLSYLAYVSCDDMLNIFDTRNIESFRVTKEDVHPDHKVWFNNAKY